MLELHTWKTPNGRKPAIMLEELGIDYELIPVDLRTGVQHEAAFKAITVNGKIPALVDRIEGEEPITVFESAAILHYLGEKTHSPLAGSDPRERAAVYQWTYFQMAAVGPIFGQTYHFRNADEQIPYAQKRFSTEAQRVLDLMNDHLSKNAFMAGENFTIADITLYPWLVAFQPVMEDASYIDNANHSHVRAYMDRVGERPAVQKGMAIFADL